ncbi:MAG: GyrI-like domain-containing protein [Actinomycetota bacterium]
MGYKFEIKQIRPRLTATIREKTTQAELGAKFAELLPEIASVLKDNDVASIGAPFGRFHSFNDQEVDLEAGIGVAMEVERMGRVRSSSLPGDRVAVTWHIGPYTTLGEAHEAIIKWIAEKGLTIDDAPWEVYWTDPMQEHDSAKWRTELIYPLTPG